MTPETEDKIVHQLISFEELVKHLATKEDLADLRTEMHKEFRGQTWKLTALILPIYALLVVLILALIPHLK